MGPLDRQPALSFTADTRAAPRPVTAKRGRRGGDSCQGLQGPRHRLQRARSLVIA
jgi:hypothetical protein